MGGLDGISLRISVSYKTLLFFGHPGKQEGFLTNGNVETTILSRGNYRRKYMNKGKNETFIFTKVIILSEFYEWKVIWITF